MRNHHLHLLNIENIGVFMPKTSANDRSRFTSEDMLSHFGKSFPEVNLMKQEIYWLHKQISATLDSQMESMLAEYDLSSGRFLLLILLNQYPEGLRPTELAQLSGVTQATISGLLLSLERAKLVSREMHHSDARSFVIRMTPSGIDQYKILQPLFLKIVDQFYTHLDSTEVNFLKNILQKMIITKTESEASLN